MIIVTGVEKFFKPFLRRSRLPNGLGEGAISTSTTRPEGGPYIRNL